MKLETYLTERKLSQEAFGRLINRSQAAVGRYMSGKRFPDKETITAIHNATDGKVTLADWYDMEPAE